MKSYRTISRFIFVIMLVLLLAAVPFSSVNASAEGPNNPGIGNNLGGIGTEAWVNPGEITTPGSPYATVTLYQGHRYSNYLSGSQYGFTIPLDATITGIEVSINHRSSARNPSVVDNVVSLVKAGSIVGNNQGIASQWPTTFTIVTYGGPTDLWGTTWTPAEINDSDFGVVLAAYRNNNGNSARDAYVDSIQVSVYYEYTDSTSIVCGDGSPITYGDSVSCVATITRQAGTLTPTGSVAWTSDGSGSFTPNPCTLSGADGTATCSANYTPSAVGSGSHALTATYSGDDFFSTSSASQTVTVMKRPITVTADPKTKVFGSQDPVLTYQVTSGSVVFTDTFTGTLTRDPGENAGPYNITQGSLALPPSYNLTFVGSIFTITKADPTCAVTPYNLTYDGTEHSATGSCTGVLAEPLTGLDLTSTAHTNAGDFTDPWTFTDTTGNYNNTSGSVNDIIGMAKATCSVTPYDLTYDTNPHTATGACTGLYAVPLVGLDLSATTHTEAGNYTDPWSFSDPNGNYQPQSGETNDIIAQATATCSVNPYDVPYDANLHTADGTCTGIGGLPLDGLDLSATTHTHAGTYLADAWSFLNPNYLSQNGTVDDTITKADPTCVITPYDVTFDGFAHTASGACTGVTGDPLTGLDLSASTHLAVGSYTDPWAFTDQSGDYNDASGSVVDYIAKATPNCTFTPYDLTYDATPHTAQGFCSGVNGEPLAGLNLDATTHTNAGSFSDAWTFTDQTGNYNNASGTVADHIAKAGASCQVNGYSVEYDRNAHSATGACTGVQGENLLGLDLSATTHTVVGAYLNDPWSFTDQTGNYNNASGAVNDQVTKRLIIVTADSQTKSVGKPDPALTYHFNAGALLAGDSFSGNLSRQPGEVAGIYAILQGSLSLPDYYEITFVSANFTIVGTVYLFPIVIK